MPAATPELTISQEQARRFLVKRHLLDPPRSLPADPESVLKVVERLGLLQFDPLDVTGARSHEILLHSRIAGYRRGWCEQWLYGEDRRLIELYNKSLNMLPIEELALYRVAWDRDAAEMEARVLGPQAELAAAILARIEAEGPLSTAAFANQPEMVDWWWAPTRASRAVMEALFVVGRLGIARREGNRRYYDLIERLVPPERLAARAPQESGSKHRLLSCFRATGMTSPRQGALAEPMYNIGKVAERERWTAELVEEGTLMPLGVEGIRGTRYILAEEKPVLEAARDSEQQTQPAVSFLAPLDPLVWDRRLLRDLWGFDYLWEIYMPQVKRRWGYYVLPILFGDRFAGRIEPRYERTTRTLRIVGASLEEPVATADPRFLPALARALEAYRSFLGARRVSWPKRGPGRELASALRHLD